MKGEWLEYRALPHGPDRQVGDKDVQSVADELPTLGPKIWLGFKVLGPEGVL
jgi:hypothetical protein